MPSSRQRDKEIAISEKTQHANSGLGISAADIENLICAWTNTRHKGTARFIVGMISDSDQSPFGPSV
jgi:hypothetical protein